jgi:biopolymer transport protein ExbB
MLTDFFLRATNTGAEWVLLCLIVLSVVSLWMILDRVVYFHRHKIDADELGSQLQQRLANGEIRSATDLITKSNSIECQVVAAGLAEMSRGSQACGEAMLSVKARERRNLDSGLAVLGSIGSNAPFIGLLGTVLGIIKAAHDLADSGKGSADPNLVMAGVFEALVATAVGLVVAVPAVLAFNYFQRRVKLALLQTDALAHLVLSRCPATATQRPRPTTPNAPGKELS